MTQKPDRRRLPSRLAADLAARRLKKLQPETAKKTCNCCGWCWPATPDHFAWREIGKSFQAYCRWCVAERTQELREIKSAADADRRDPIISARAAI
jgi:hypothetical protein